jgi:hypothetical protein
MKKVLLLLILLFTSVHLYALDIGFMGITLGMTRDEVLEFADNKDLIKVPKNRDVEFFPVENRKILTLSIEPEVPHIYLQFYNEKLYAITVVFDEDAVDFFTLARTLEEKYGPYTTLTPTWRKWKTGGSEIKVEKPAVVKYIAMEEFLEVTDFSIDEPVDDRKTMLLEGL